MPNLCWMLSTCLTKFDKVDNCGKFEHLMCENGASSPSSYKKAIKWRHDRRGLASSGPDAEAPPQGTSGREPSLPLNPTSAAAPWHTGWSLQLPGRIFEMWENFAYSSKLSVGESSRICKFADISPRSAVFFDVIFSTFWGWSDVKLWKWSCRPWSMLQNEYVVAEIGFDTGDNGP